jgi:uncharacterized membrane protein YuzA (DUF378 family)
VPFNDGFPATSGNKEVVMATMNPPMTDRRHIPERRTASSTRVSRMTTLDYAAMALLIIGGLNWAMVGLFGVDVVASLFGVQSPGTRLVYLLVGIAALYSIYLAVKMANRH